MIAVALGVVLILAGVLAVLWLRALRQLDDRNAAIAERDVLIRHQAERLDAYRAELAGDPINPMACGQLIPFEAAAYLATFPASPAEES